MGFSRLGRGLLLLLLPAVIFLALGEGVLRLYLTQRLSYDVEIARYAQLLKIDSGTRGSGMSTGPGPPPG